MQGVLHPSALTPSLSHISGKKVALRAPKTQEQQEGPLGHMPGAEDIAGDRGQSCSVLDSVHTKNPAREEQSWALQSWDQALLSPSLFVTKIGSTG